MEMGSGCGDFIARIKRIRSARWSEKQKAGKKNEK